MWTQDATELHRQIEGDVLIECAKDGSERNDVVATLGEMEDMGKRAEYDGSGDAHIQIKQVFSFGVSTSILKVHRVSSTRLFIALCMKAAVNRLYSGPIQYTTAVL